MDIKVIITDLDQTLLHTDKTISDYSVDVLNRCRKAGKKIVFATARSKQASSKYFERFMPDVFVGYGGSLVLAENAEIYRFDIPADISSSIIKECLETPEITSILAVNESIALTNNLNEMTDTGHYQYTDSILDYYYRYLKISVISTSQDAVEKIAANYPMCDMLRYTGENLYRFANRDAVKWNAVNAIAKYYNLDTNAFAAFGDDVNDMEMVEKCGVGIAVANAIDEVKAAADYICDSNDNDGVAKWLEENVLK